MTSPGQIECGGEEYLKWCSDTRYEILVVETPRPGVYKFSPRLKSLSVPQCSSGESQSRPFPAQPVKIMESAGQYTQPNAAGGSGETVEKPNASKGAPKEHATALDLPSQPEEADNLFGNASPPTPSGVASPSPQETSANVPAGTLSHRIELLPADVPDFLLRMRRMEIAITGQMSHPDGRHTIFEYVEAKSMPKTETKPAAAKPEPLKVFCAFCQGPLEEDGTCKICEIGESIFTQARANRKAYHEKKKAGL